MSESTQVMDVYASMNGFFHSTGVLIERGFPCGLSRTSLYHQGVTLYGNARNPFASAENVVVTRWKNPAATSPFWYYFFGHFHRNDPTMRNYLDKVPSLSFHVLVERIFCCMSTERGQLGQTS